MTGIDTKHGDKKEIYHKLGLKKLVDISVTEAVNVGMLSDYKINIVEVAMSEVKDLEVGPKDKKFFTSEAKNYDYLDEQANRAIYSNSNDLTYRILARMHFIKGSKSKLEVAKWLIKNLEGRKLVFAGNINMAENLCSNTYHSKTDNTDLQKFMSGEIDTIAMVNKGGTGFTYKAIDHLILCQADSNKNGLTEQKVGRVLLKQKNHIPTVWVVKLLGTQDSSWVRKALLSFDQSKVEIMRYENLKNKAQLLTKQSK